MQMITTNHKTDLCEPYGFLAAGLFLAPNTLSGWNVCPWSTVGCRAACNGWTAGMNVYETAHKAKIERTLYLRDDPECALAQIHDEVGAHERRAKRKGLRAAVRLNGSSDLMWEKIFPEIFRDYSRVQFYDYTKGPSRMATFAKVAFDPSTPWPANYDLTWSVSETNHEHTRTMIALGQRIVLPIAPGIQPPGLPAGYGVENGDLHDLTWMWPRKTCLLLSPKGAGKKDMTGFVVR